MAMLSVPSMANSTSVSSGNETIVGNTSATAVGALILSLVFLLGFPGNIFVIWSILARARKQSVTTLIILNLAIADGSLMALTPFFITYLVMKKWVFGKEMCKILFYLCLVNMYASIHLIMLMSIYRLVAVLFPKRVSFITNQRIIMRILVVVWVLVIIASVPAAIFRNVQKTVCDSFHHTNSQTVIQYTLELALGFLIPYVVILVSYMCILRRIRQTKFRRRIRSENLILAIVLTFCLFWLPYHVVNIVQVCHACFAKYNTFFQASWMCNISSLNALTMCAGLIFVKYKEMLLITFPLLLTKQLPITLRLHGLYVPRVQ